MTVTAAVYADLYRAHSGRVDVVDVPELGYVSIDGQGSPEGPDFSAAISALYAVSYGAHFRLKNATGQAPKVMPLEACWWVDDPRQQPFLEEVAAGRATMADTDRELWRWQAFIMQPPPIDTHLVAAAIARAEQRAGHDPSALARVRFSHWTEGLCAQVLHVGPYRAEGPTIARLHAAIAEGGYRPRGRHHEIYLGDPRRSAPERLRTILRHPIEPA